MHSKPPGTNIGHLQKRDVCVCVGGEVDMHGLNDTCGNKKQNLLLLFFFPCPIRLSCKECVNNVTNTAVYTNPPTKVATCNFIVTMLF